MTTFKRFSKSVISDALLTHLRRLYDRYRDSHSVLCELLVTKQYRVRREWLQPDTDYYICEHSNGPKPYHCVICESGAAEPKSPDLDFTSETGFPPPVEPTEDSDEPIDYNVEEAIRIAGLWRAGKMIGGDQDGVRDALLAEVERLRLPETKF